METNLDEQMASEMNFEPARPQFLSVLCILTWVACGFIFITTTWGIIFKPSPEKQMEQIEQIRAVSPDAADKMEAALESQSGTTQILQNLLTLIAVAISAYAAMLMWQLKKNGFYLYLVGEILPYFGFLIVGTEGISAVGSMTGMGGSIVGMVIAIMVIVDGVFIGMYAANLKHMNKTV